MRLVLEDYAQRLGVVPCPGIATRLQRLKTRSELREAVEEGCHRLAREDNEPVT